MWLDTAWGRLRDYLGMLVLVALSVGIQVGCDKSYEATLSIEKQTEVYAIEQIPSSSSSSEPESEPSDTRAELGKVIRVLKPGETAKAIGVYHGKGYDAFHVKLADGTEGLIIAGDTFTATSP